MGHPDPDLPTPSDQDLERWLGGLSFLDPQWDRRVVLTLRSGAPALS